MWLGTAMDLRSVSLEHADLAPALADAAQRVTMSLEVRRSPGVEVRGWWFRARRKERRVAVGND